MPRETEKNCLLHRTVGGMQMVEHLLVGEIKMDIERWNLKVFFFFFLLRFRTHVVATSVCVWREVYTHSVSHAHFSDTSFCAWRTDIACTYGSRCLQCACHILSISPSPFSCFIRRPCCSRTVTLTPPFPSAPSSSKCPPTWNRWSGALPHERRGVWLPCRFHALHTRRKGPRQAQWPAWRIA